MRQTVQRRLLGLAVAVAFFSFHSTHAQITWGTAQDISGDTDVQTGGTLFAAYTIGGPNTSPPSTTVNGVTFSPFLAPNATTVTVGNVTLTGTAMSAINGHTGIFGSSSPPFSNLSSAYQTLLSSDANTGGPGFGPMTVTIGGLTLGDTYQVQFWVNDSRGGIGNMRTETITNGPTLSFNTESTGNGEGGVGQYAIGTWTAGSTSESFVATGNVVSQVNALQVREVGAVPEPSSWVLAGIGLSLAWFVARRQRQVAA